CKTIIGFGSPNKQGKEDCHGAPLGDDEIALVREKLNWPYPAFEIPSEIASQWNAREAGQSAEANWNDKFVAYKEAHPQLAVELERRLNNRLPEDFAEQAQAYIEKLQAEGPVVASRKASQMALNAYSPLLPEMVGGSADLAGSNLTISQTSKGIEAKDASGNYLYYGVREFGMCAIMNGMALHGGFMPYGGTFLIFMEYARNALRMAALMKQQAIYVFTHDSIGLGEDGPTHQPIEQLANMRLTPNMSVWRPCDAVETAVAWKAAIERRDGPTALSLSRQNLAHQERDNQQLDNVARGGYILVDSAEKPELIFIATGSEVELAVNAAKELSAKGKQVRVVSMPSTDTFEAQDAAYRESVLPSDVLARVAVEAAIADYWYKYVGLDGRIVGMNSFGESAPAGELFEHFGFTVDNVVAVAEEIL
ncbi:MAG: transketolase, partial [Kangiellaceae bacterium]|nr:transketolase [Kangiellaceae bacterium]